MNPLKFIFIELASAYGFDIKVTRADYLQMFCHQLENWICNNDILSLI